MVINILAIISEIKKWQLRILGDIYPIFFIDAVYFSVKEENKAVKKATYIVLGINKEGYKKLQEIKTWEENWNVYIYSLKI